MSTPSTPEAGRMTTAAEAGMALTTLPHTQQTRSGQSGNVACRISEFGTGAKVPAPPLLSAQSSIVVISATFLLAEVRQSDLMASFPSPQFRLG